MPTGETDYSWLFANRKHSFVRSFLPSSLPSFLPPFLPPFLPSFVPCSLMSLARSLASRSYSHRDWRTGAAEATLVTAQPTFTCVLSFADRLRRLRCLLDQIFCSWLLIRPSVCSFAIRWTASCLHVCCASIHPLVPVGLDEGPHTPPRRHGVCVCVCERTCVCVCERTCVCV